MGVIRCKGYGADVAHAGHFLQAVGDGFFDGDVLARCGCSGVVVVVQTDVLEASLLGTRLTAAQPPAGDGDHAGEGVGLKGLDVLGGDPSGAVNEDAQRVCGHRGILQSTRAWVNARSACRGCGRTSCRGTTSY